MPNSFRNQNLPLRTISFLRNSLRAKQIAIILLRNGFEELVAKIRGGKAAKRFPRVRLKLSIWKRIRKTCEELGPTFVKFAQIISTREDILPQALLREFKKLRDHVSPVPWDEIEELIDNEIDGGIEKHFSQFEKKPFAAGSIGQVYRAVLKNGKVVAVKIRRPGAGKAMKADFEILEWLIKQAAETFPELSSYDLPGILAEIREGVLREIDFTFEAKNAKHFNAINDNSKVFAPQVIEEISSARVLVTEWIEGLPPGDKRIVPEQARELSLAGGESVFRQIFLFGFFHADPHPGNMLVTGDGRLCFLDWGCAGTLSRRMRYFLADIFAAVAKMDAEQVLQVALRTRPPELRINRSKLEAEIAIVLRRYSDFHLNSQGFGHMIFEMLRVFADNNFALPRDYALLAKSIVVMEESGRQLDKDFDLGKIAVPVLKQLYRERHKLFTLGREAIALTDRQIAYIKEMPESVQRIFWKMEAGELKLNVDYIGLTETRVTLTSAANRLALATIIAAFLISSALLVCAASFKVEFELAHHLGVIGFVAAALSTIWLFWLIVFRRK